MSGPETPERLAPHANPPLLCALGRDAKHVIASALLILALMSTAALSVEPGEMLDDPAKEARARALSGEIRCLVCQNQSIDDSDASLARDLRLLVRQQITAGKSDQAIRDFLVKRYGDFVLLRPPVKRSTWLLWFGPLVVFVGGIAGLAIYFRRRGRSAPSEGGGLSDDERERIARLLREDNRPA